ncbi:M48 family metalloprotease [Nonlabens ulvanivorans]|uniref:Peptidase M48 n=1 Tax=Nonlabens ulvanivorans TaxID=906888 RepID=A0A084JT93_NONUL|nr:M48 family metalloprotease [Nonlabens ulvanivorans]KEZ92177.1 peptidase M48 [Nonlabens ulvanivorans]PRX15005.1 peptidase M48-like protein [Nonlabens ulvanivorans]
MSDDLMESKAALEPFPYHKMLRDHLKSRKKTWQWFKDEKVKTQQIESFKKELLKNTYRLDTDSHRNLYQMAQDICVDLNIDAQVTLYQENNSLQLNASISVIDQEAHIVFSGNILQLLDEKQLKALLAHELSHYLFYKLEDGEYEITQRIILALANDSRSEDSIIETARIFQLYLELFCDAGAFKSCREHYTVIQMLIKLNTGLSEVNAQSYLNQAKEIINQDDEATNQQTHPESYIRSIALDLKARNSREYHEELHKLIEGKWDVNSLDIFEQEKTRALSRDFIQIILRPQWMNSSAVLNLAQQFFTDFAREKEVDTTKLLERLKHTTPSTKSYLSYVLLDFARIDSELEKLPIAHTLEIAELLGLIEEYERVLRKELKLSVRSFKDLKQEAMTDLSNVNENQDNSIYDNE